MTFIVKMHLIYTILLNEINWEKKMNVISDLAYHTCMNNNLLLVQLFKQTLTQFFFFNSFVMSQHIILKMHIVKYDHEIH